MADSGKEVEEERNQGTEGDQEQLNDDELYGEEEEEVGDEEQMNEEVDPEFEEMKRRVQEMEEEQEKLTKLQQQVEKQINTAADGIDENSVYVGQVDYEATTDELRGHFAPCGTIKRVTILCDKFTGHAKGFAYVEFYDKASVENALRLDDSTFLGRQIKVLPKRHNVLSEEVVVVGDEAVGEVEDHLEGEVGDAEDTSEEDGPVGEAITAHTIKVW
eukprot:CAMPEP_0185022198 /NCGR_PEP_ID=MMETSP1103-20130426/4928_1 /TAXON_ID=36769 /ORGANISM="Paraphysomonas bandaiensis, Strain Caron Lab Isolate" /LENGTH=216 /DNA_ID=CAMNT_0027554165 /DNA_START=20 /DNA_END=668 /DNA_ORIENTATION=-